jgi:hypothetical protein
MSARTIRTLQRKSVRAGRAASFALNRMLRRFDDKLLVIGEGRSGTTWLANLLNFDNRYRVMLEPFQSENLHPRAAYESEYLFPDSDGETAVAALITETLNGDYISGHVNAESSIGLYSGLLIKDISAQLILDEVCARAPGMKKVFILRHPFAVATSKGRNFEWSTRLLSFLSMHNPRRDELADVADVIEATAARDDFLLTQVTLWCISHRYALSSRAIPSFSVVLYEDLATNPEQEISRLFSELGMEDRYCDNRQAIGARIGHESHVTFANNTIDDTRKGRAVWQEQWDGATIEAGLGILARFGFDTVYAEGFAPLISAGELTERMLSRPPRSSAH